MSSGDKSSKGKEGKPLLAFSDAADAQHDKNDASSSTKMQTPPWTPPATPEQRAELYRSHKSLIKETGEAEKATSSQKTSIENDEQLSSADQPEEVSNTIDTDAKPSNLNAIAEKQTEPATPSPAGKSRDGWQPLIDPATAIDVIRNARTLLLTTTLLGGIVGVLYALSLPQTYVASTDILVDPRNIKIVGTELTPGQLPTDASLAIAESQARMIDSSSVLLKVIDKADLINDPEFNGSLVPTGIAGFVSQLGGLQKPKVESSAEALKTRVLYNLYKSLSIRRDPKTFIYSIAVKTRSPEKSAELANLVSSVFQTELDSLQSDTARRTSEELSKRLADMRNSVESAEKSAADFREKHDLVNVDGKLILDNDLTRLNDQLTNQRAETMRLQARAQSISDASPSALLSGALPEDSQSNTLTALRAQYAEISQLADGMSTRLGPRHPQLIQAQTQKQAILNAINGELQRIRSSLQVEAQRSVQQEKNLAKRLEETKIQQASNNENLIKLRELEREASTLRSVYEAFMLRTRETSEQEGISTTNIRVLSEARPPLEPTGSSRKLIVIAGFIIGFFAGLGITILRNFRRLLRLA